MAVSIIPKYLAFELIVHASIVADEIWGDMPEPARRDI